MGLRQGAEAAAEAARQARAEKNAADFAEVERTRQAHRCSLNNDMRIWSWRMGLAEPPVTIAPDGQMTGGTIMVDHEYRAWDGSLRVPGWVCAFTFSADDIPFFARYQLPGNQFSVWLESEPVGDGLGRDAAFWIDLPEYIKRRQAVAITNLETLGRA